MELTASRYNIHIPLLDGGALVYNSAHGNFQRLTAAQVTALAQIAEGKQSEVAQEHIDVHWDNGYAIKTSVDELAHLRRHYEAHRFDYNSMTLTIAPTMACNFGCDYCFQGANKPSESMSPAVQDATIKFVETAAERGLKSYAP